MSEPLMYTDGLHWYTRDKAGKMSGLMSHKKAQAYSETFGVTIHKHSKAPKRTKWWEINYGN